MQLQNIFSIFFHHFSLFLIINVTHSWATLTLNTFKIDNYYMGSSKVYKIEHSSKLRKREVKVSSRPEFLFDLKLYNDGRPLTIYIRQRDSDIVAEKSMFLKIFNVSDNGYDSIPMDFRNNSNLYEGYITDLPENSSVSGYIKDDNFYGHLIVNDSFYYIDELREWDFDLTNGTISIRNAIIFKRDSVVMGVILKETKSARAVFQELMRQNYYNKKFQEWKQNGMLCPLVVVIDYSFLTKVHKSNVEAAVFQVLYTLEEANAVFRSTDLDGDGVPDNIGFYVKKLVVVYTEQPPYFLPKFQSNMAVSDYLIQFMTYDELPKHCLGLALTAQKFEKGTLGASYTPDSTSLYPVSGICDEFNPKLGTMNSLVVTASTIRTPLVSQIVFEVTITHELGHSFGSTHDTSLQCFGHVMSPRSLGNYYENRTHVVFSPCSTEHIMRTVVMKGNCFEPVQTSFCGNGLVEDGEDCDCGLTRDCLRKDPCCVPRRTKEYPCKINKRIGFECHPSQGQCCTKECKYSSHLATFVNCRNFDETCPCSKNETSCNCGLNGVCIEDQCHSIECSRLQLKECQCEATKSDKTCEVCCQLNDKCLPAIEATNQLVSSASIKHLSWTKYDQSIYKAKQFISKTFCQNTNQCTSLPFFQGKVDGYCLYRGKLGRCQPDLKCEIFKSNQSFPSFESASTKYQFNAVNMFCYLFLNTFLIEMLH